MYLHPSDVLHCGGVLPLMVHGPQPEQDTHDKENQCKRVTKLIHISREAYSSQLLF